MKKKGMTVQTKLGIIIPVTLVMGIKNLNAMVYEGYYYQQNGVTLWTYPYISVFNQEKINDYFDYQDGVGNIYNYNVGDQELWRVEEQQ